ncbi:hypothetical protein EYF80_001361 [Liparis tanakae]|uniref:Uncharacterized protein n=1 Tax=Liparis tanakae TaxID=230148 RepID=A0A4Z2JG25_9TELE|nr:hypothetical protein EYF80_001361 [Liparis tanakae]
MEVERRGWAERLSRAMAGGIRPSQTLDATLKDMLEYYLTNHSFKKRQLRKRKCYLLVAGAIALTILIGSITQLSASPNAGRFSPGDAFRHRLVTSASDVAD